NLCAILEYVKLHIEPRYFEDHRINLSLLILFEPPEYFRQVPQGRLSFVDRLREVISLAFQELLHVLTREPEEFSNISQPHVVRRRLDECCARDGLMDILDRAGHCIKGSSRGTSKV